MSRKTIPVAEVVRRGNHMLAESVPGAREGRIAIAILLEDVLMATGNYKGFQYLASEYLPAAEQTDGNVLRPDYDDSRRRYYGGQS